MREKTAENHWQRLIQTKRVEVIPTNPAESLDIPDNGDKRKLVIAILYKDIFLIPFYIYPYTCVLVSAVAVRLPLAVRCQLEPVFLRKPS